MSDSAVDRNLLFGILALQNNFINREALLAAFAAWVVDKRRPLGEILCEQGKLTQVQDELLRALTEQHVKQHGNDPEQSLAAVSSIGSIRADLRKLGDPHLEASLAAFGQEPPTADPNLTVFPSTCDWGPLGHRFRVLRPHAKGGLGEVFVAQDLELHREVALKEIQSQYADHPDSRSRFVLEAEITGGLEHPGIVPVYGLGQYADGRPYYAMRFIRGDSLKDAIERFHKGDVAGRDSGERSLELRKLLGRFIDVCEAIEYAHSRGILHRDLKPGNIMLGKYGETLVVDWGLAKPVGRGELTSETGDTTLRPASGDSVDPTMMGKVIGTPAFMSPEQAAGRLDELGPASDVYSLGATLYCLLTGQPPFSGNDKGAILTHVERGEFPAPRVVKPQVPLALQAICLKAMAIKQADRYLSPTMLADDIEHWLADEPVSSYPEPPLVRARRWVKRHRAWAMSGAVALALVAVVSTVAAFWINGQKQVIAKQEREATKSADRNAALAIEKSKLADEKIALAELEQSARKKADRQTKLAERHLYVAHMNLAQSAWEQNHVGQTIRLLDLYMPIAMQESGAQDLRGFEWFFWDRLCHSDLFTLAGHTGDVHSVAFSPDGKRLATASWDKTVKVWDAATGQETLALMGHASSVNSVVFSPDGKRLASASDDETVKLWDAASGEESLTLKHNDAVKCAAFSPDGKRLATASWGSDKTVRVWDTATGQETLTPKSGNGPAMCVVFSPDGKLLASTGVGDTVVLSDTVTGHENFTLKGHDYGINCVAFSADGRRLATACMDQTVTVWDLDTRLMSRTLKGHTSWVESVAFSPDGKRLASAEIDRTVKVWDVATGRESLTLKGHVGGVYSVAFSPDGQRLVSASQDGTVKVWDADTGRESLGRESLTLTGHSGKVVSVAFSPIGQRLASASWDGSIKVWDTTSGQEVFTLKGHTSSVTNVAFTQDGQRLASTSSDGTTKIWDTGTGVGVRTLTREYHVGYGLALSSDGKRLASANYRHELKVLDAATGQELLTMKGHTLPILCVAFSPSGKWLVSASSDRTIKLWDAGSGRDLLTLKGHRHYVNCVVFSADGKRLASASDDKTVKVWDAASGQEILTLKGHNSKVNSVAFNPDGKRLASASSDHSVKVWELATGQETITLRGHTGEVESVAFSADGKRLASASDDETVKVWDATPREAKAALATER